MLQSVFRSARQKIAKEESEDDSNDQDDEDESEAECKKRDSCSVYNHHFMDTINNQTDLNISFSIH